MDTAIVTLMFDLPRKRLWEGGKSFNRFVLNVPWKIMETTMTAAMTMPRREVRKVVNPPVAG
jgi:hypothetical protein